LAPDISKSETIHYDDQGGIAEWTTRDVYRNGGSVQCNICRRIYTITSEGGFHCPASQYDKCKNCKDKGTIKNLSAFEPIDEETQKKIKDEEIKPEGEADE
jgi:transposase-like protein